MKFGLQFDFRNPPDSGRSNEYVYRSTLELIELAEALGFDDIWLSEHHFVDDGFLPSPMTMAAAVAARTRRVAIGTIVLLTPLYHPIRLAEDCAVVDVLSNGRFRLGAALGYRREEFAGLGVDRSRRGALMEETIEIVRRCWREEEFTHNGAHFHFENVRCTPKPVQKPGIPIWIGASQGRAIERAARIGDGWIGGMPGFADHALYFRTLEELDRSTRDVSIAGTGASFLFCSEDPDSDWQKIGGHALRQAQTYRSWLDAAEQAGVIVPSTPDEIRNTGWALCGTPEEVIANVRSSYEVAPFTHHFFGPVFSGADPALSGRSIELFAEHVIPALRDVGERA